MQFAGDVLSLTLDGQALTVNATWVQALQEEQLGETGCVTKGKPKDDVRCMNSVLNWIYEVVISPGDLVRVVPGRLEPCCI